MNNINENRNVFINCPYDKAYQPLEDAIVFAIIDCGFKPRSAKESSASDNRIKKIEGIIEECCFAVHDISRIELNKNYPRFNMPFELGLYLGAKRFGNDAHAHKQLLIFDKNRHRYEKFISDIKGHDVHGHNNEPKKLIGPIRDFLAEAAEDQKILLANDIYKKYRTFRRWMETVHLKRGIFGRKDLSFSKFSSLIFEFLKSNEE